LRAQLEKRACVEAVGDVVTVDLGAASAAGRCRQFEVEIGITVKKKRRTTSPRRR